MRNSDQHDNGGPSPSDITQWLSTRKGEDSAALGKLLPLKARAEYEPDYVSRSAATRAVTAASRTVAIARQVVPEARSATDS